MKIKTQDVAVVGMSCIFPGAENVTKFWDNIVDKKSAIQDAPEHRIPKKFYDPNTNAVDRHSVIKGGFVDEFLMFDPIEFGMVPNSVKGTEPDQLMALKLAKDALVDAGVFDKNLSLEKAGIIIGKGGSSGIESLKFNEVVTGAENIYNLLKACLPHLTEDELNRAKADYQKQFGKFSSENIMGTVPNLISSLISNRFNFGGPAYTLDAACASSLLGVDHGMRELQSGRCDLMVIGAIHLGQTPSFWSFFQTLGALSKQQQVRPFDKNADGVLAGEGCGFVVLKTLKDAVRDGHRIYSVIKGVGIASDGSHASVMSPSSVGQVKAIDQAWSFAGLDKKNIGFIETHGTGTGLGDKTELETLAAAFPQKEANLKAGLGAVKANIGHPMAAAGMAGFIKTSMALYKGIIPPTINCDDPLDSMDDTCFKPVQDEIDWQSSGLPLVAGVNAFGFGGANAHAVLTQYQSEGVSDKNKVLLLARNSLAELRVAIETEDYTVGVGQYRIAVFNPTPKRLELALRVIDKGIDWRGRQDIWMVVNPLLAKNEKLSFLFPGLDLPALDALSETDLRELAAGFDLELGFDEANGLSKNKARVLEVYQSHIIKALAAIGLHADSVGGHSLGEWTACGAYNIVDADSIVALNEVLSHVDFQPIDAQYLTIDCSLEELKPYLDSNSDVYLSNENCFQQVVVAARPNVISEFKERLLNAGISSRILPFETGYHSPFAAEHYDLVKDQVSTIVKFKKPKIDLWSCITAKKYPHLESDIRQLHKDFITQPVRFREMIENMYKDGSRVFVQIGAGALVGFVSNILAKKEHAIFASGSSKLGTISQIKRVVAAVFTEGRAVDLSFLDLLPVKKVKRKGLTFKVDMTYPFIDGDVVVSSIRSSLKADSSHSHSHSHSQSAAAASNASNTALKERVLNSFSENIQQMNRVQDEFLLRMGSPSATQKSVIKQDMHREFQLDSDVYPFLKDYLPYKTNTSTASKNHVSGLGVAGIVVPMAMYIELAIDLFSTSQPGVTLSSARSVILNERASTACGPSVSMHGRWIDNETVRFSIKNVFEVDFSLNQDEFDETLYQTSKAMPKKLPVIDSEIYNEAYIPHGQSYQGIKNIGILQQNSIEVSIRGQYAKGALIDSAIQAASLLEHFSSLGYRKQIKSIAAINYFQSPLDQSGEFSCRVVKNDDSGAINVLLSRQNKAWCEIRGIVFYENDIDEHAWSVITKPEMNFLTQSIDDSLCVMDHSRYQDHFSQNLLSSHYYFGMDTCSDWSGGAKVIAVKDAIRKNILSVAQRVIHPASLEVNKVSENVFYSTIDSREYYATTASSGDFSVAIQSDKKSIVVIEEKRELECQNVDIPLANNNAFLGENEGKLRAISKVYLSTVNKKSLTDEDVPVRKLSPKCFSVGGKEINVVHYKNHYIAWSI
ncbi:MAG: acyl transferase domain-containing protein [Flavobacteriales bacterium]|jgi:acyl transferase domain-containing protein